MFACCVWFLTVVRPWSSFRIWLTTGSSYNVKIFQMTWSRFRPLFISGSVIFFFFFFDDGIFVCCLLFDARDLVTYDGVMLMTRALVVIDDSNRGRCRLSHLVDERMMHSASSDDNDRFHELLRVVSRAILSAWCLLSIVNANSYRCDTTVVPMRFVVESTRPPRTPPAGLFLSADKMTRNLSSVVYVICIRIRHTIACSFSDSIYHTNAAFVCVFPVIDHFLFVIKCARRFILWARFAFSNSLTRHRLV